MTVVDAMECEDVMQKQKFYKEKPKNKKTPVSAKTED